MIEVLKEVTPWEFNNNIYVVDKKTSKLVAYIKTGTEELIKLNTPMRFDKRLRKFSKVASYKSLAKLEGL